MNARREAFAVLLLLSLVLFSNIAAATFNIGDPPTREESGSGSDSGGMSSITGHAVADPDDSDVAYVLFLVALCIILIGGIIFLFQRVKPR